MNWTSKETLAKLIVETCGDWVAFLPFTLYRVRHSPYTLGLTAFGIVFGRAPIPPPQLAVCLLTEFSDVNLLTSLNAAASVFKDIWPRLQQVYEKALPPSPHQFQPGDWVYVRRQQHRTLEPHWKGPCVMILTTSTESRPMGLPSGLHHSHAGMADPPEPAPDDPGPHRSWTIKPDRDNPLRLKPKVRSPDGHINACSSPCPTDTRQGRQYSTSTSNL